MLSVWHRQGKWLHLGGCMADSDGQIVGRSFDLSWLNCKSVVVLSYLWNYWWCVCTKWVTVSSQHNRQTLRSRNQKGTNRERRRGDGAVIGGSRLGTYKGSVSVWLSLASLTQLSSGHVRCGLQVQAFRWITFWVPMKVPCYNFPYQASLCV